MTPTTIAAPLTDTDRIAPLAKEENRLLRIDVLIGLLGDDDPGVRTDAACMLGIMGAAAREAQPALRRALRDPEAGVRRYASIALGRIAEATGGFSAPVGAF